MWATGTGSDMWKRIAAPHAEQVSPELVPPWGRSSVRGGSLPQTGAGSVERHHAP